MKCAAALLLASICGVSAFVAPAPRVSRGRAMRMSVNDLIGADTETGGVWDPLGLSQNEASLRKYRECELKHGRIAMAAMLGIVTQTFYHLPDEVFNNPKPLAALQQVYSQRPEAIWQLIVFLGAIEATSGRQQDDREPGDLGFGASFKPKTDEEYSALQLKELKNGRLAMVASMGCILQEYLGGENPITQALNGDINPFGDGKGFF